MFSRPPLTVYTRRQIKNDQPGSHYFRQFISLCVNFEPISLKF